MFKNYSIKEYAQTICDIVEYDYNLIEWDTTAFVGSPNKKLINKLNFKENNFLKKRYFFFNLNLKKNLKMNPINYYNMYINNFNFIKKNFFYKKKFFFF